ncbi:MAG: hypothetical protein B6244_01830 [Candidatus Cloacimonetes bacterium 4572_55]|nr:MAG: hypothetical protein B6244_01830 [Candidatus Cloacimonetes bacterium 4572_55]
MTKASSYHYFFSRLAWNRTHKQILGIAESLAKPLINDFQLVQNWMPSDKPKNLPDITFIRDVGNEKRGTYLVQFYFNDILCSLFAREKIDHRETAIQFWQRTADLKFVHSAEHNYFGSARVCHGRMENHVDHAREIGEKCLKVEQKNILSCQFEWKSSLYHLSPKGDYVLLTPNKEEWDKEETFLTIDFPMLEVIRQKIIYEEGESEKLASRNYEIEAEITRLQRQIRDNLDGENENFHDLRKLIDQMDDLHADLYESLVKLKGIVYTLDINKENFDTYLKTLNLENDSLFSEAICLTAFSIKQIKTYTKYTELLIPGMDKRQETLRLKIELLHQKAQEENNQIERENNRIESVRNLLIGALGAGIGVGEILPDSYSIPEKIFWILLTSATSAILLWVINHILKLQRRMHSVETGGENSHE